MSCANSNCRALVGSASSSELTSYGIEAGRGCAALTAWIGGGDGGNWGRGSAFEVARKCVTGMTGGCEELVATSRGSTAAGTWVIPACAMASSVATGTCIVETIAL